jgi:hypothetical protein
MPSSVIELYYYGVNSDEVSELAWTFTVAVSPAIKN